MNEKYNIAFLEIFIVKLQVFQGSFYKYKHVESIAAFSKTGTVTNIISGLAIVFESTLLPTVLIIAGFLSHILVLWSSKSGNRD